MSNPANTRVSNNSVGGSGTGILFLLGAIALGCLFCYTSGVVWIEILSGYLFDYDVGLFEKIIVEGLIIGIQLTALILHIKLIVREKDGLGIGVGLLFHTIAAMLHVTLSELILDGPPSDWKEFIFILVVASFVLSLFPTIIGCLIGVIWRKRTLF